MKEPETFKNTKGHSDERTTAPKLKLVTLNKPGTLPIKIHHNVTPAPRHNAPYHPPLLSEGKGHSGVHKLKGHCSNKIPYCLCLFLSPHTKGGRNIACYFCHRILKAAQQTLG